jgi:hypothetical protein
VTPKVCTGCDKPLGADGNCHTPFCIQNETFDETEFIRQQSQRDADAEQAARDSQPEPDRDDLHGLPPETEPEEPESMEEFDQQNEQRGEEDLPEAPESESEGDDDSDLPPRPMGCEGECEPTDNPGPDDVICPHCTAKMMRDQIQEQEGENNKSETRYMSNEMNQVQERRFDEVVRRTGRFIERNFGERAEDFYIGPKQESRFDGEDVAQTIQVTSDDGVTYFVTIGVMRSPGS